MSKYCTGAHGFNLTGTIYPMGAVYDTGDGFTINGGFSAFVHGLPTGAAAWVRA